MTFLCVYSKLINAPQIPDHININITLTLLLLTKLFNQYKYLEPKDDEQSPYPPRLTESAMESKKSRRTGDGRKFAASSMRKTKRTVAEKKSVNAEKSEHILSITKL